MFECTIVLGNYIYDKVLCGLQQMMGVRFRDDTDLLDIIDFSIFLYCPV